MPLLDSALTHNSSVASLGVRQPANIRRVTGLPRAQREPCDNPTSECRTVPARRTSWRLPATKAPQRAWEARRYAFNPCALRHTLVSNSGHRLHAMKGLQGLEEEAG